MKAKIVTELSCYMENKPGIMANITMQLAEKNIFIHGIQIYEGQLQSLVMIVVDDDEKAEEVLRRMGVELISRTDIVEVEIPNKVGGLASISQKFKDNKLEMRTIYSSNSNSDVSLAYVRVDDVKKAVEVLNAHEK